MKPREFRIGRLTGAAALAVLASALVVQGAHAQQGSPTPAPAPRQTPAIITLPGASSFDLRPSGSQPARPTAQPTPTPTARPTPAPSAAAPPIARATPTPRPAATGAARAEPPAPRPIATPTPLASPAAQPADEPDLVVTGLKGIAYPTPTPAPVPVAPESSGIPWLWIVIGAAMASVLVLLGWLLGRGRRAQPVEKPVAVAPERAAPPPPPPPAAAPPPPPPPPPPPSAPRPAPRPPMPMDPIMVELRPIALDLSANGVILDFELGIVNATNAPVDGIRLCYGMMSANEAQDPMIAGFHGSQLPPAVEPFKLGPREGVRVPGRIGLEADRINVIDIGGRAMFVPLLMVDLRWSAGLSLKHRGTDFMVGMGRQGEKLGPIWLDRGAQRHERLNANRYVAKPVTVAAE